MCGVGLSLQVRLRTCLRASGFPLYPSCKYYYLFILIDKNIVKAVIQRVSEASVKIDGIVKGQINRGLLVLLGVGHQDTLEDVEWLGKKIIQLRIFGDGEGKMNLSLQDIAGEVLLISQFTLHASTKKGNRPAFTEAAPPAIAIPLYEAMIQWLEQELPKRLQTGSFGADMKVALINDGPVTIVIDTQN